MSNAHPAQSPDVTQLLAQMRAGEQSAAEELFPLVYTELRRLAASYIQRERPDHTLQATALVHEAFVRMVANGPSHSDRAHFLGLAARAMRFVLVDHARARKSLKRRAMVRRVSLDERVVWVEADNDRLLAVHLALEKLEKLSPRQARVVEMRYFGGLSMKEVADALDITPKTVSRDWTVAQAWLKRELNA